MSEVYLMDNIELMKHYPDKYFDLAVVDPPYGLDLANMDMGVVPKDFRIDTKNFFYLAYKI